MSLDIASCTCNVAGIKSNRRDFKISHHAEVFELKTSFSGNVNGLLFTKFSVQYE